MIPIDPDRISRPDFWDLKSAVRGMDIVTFEVVRSSEIRRQNVSMGR